MAGDRKTSSPKAMRTKAVEGVLRVEITRLEPRPEIWAHLRRPLRPLPASHAPRHHRGAHPGGPGDPQDVPEGHVEGRGGSVHVYFADYVSYGVGGGDATSEFFFGTYLILQVGPTRPFHGDTLESLVMVRPGKNEVYPLDDVRGK